MAIAPAKRCCWPWAAQRWRTTMTKQPDDVAAFHRSVAKDLEHFYPEGKRPDGFHGVLAWHWQQAGEWRQAAIAALSLAEELIQIQDLGQAQRWSERALEFLDRMPRDQVGE